MSKAETDTRSAERKLKDEQISAEPQLSPPVLNADASPQPVESHLKRLQKRPVALMGIVENGLVRPLDPSVKFAEQSRVIIISTEPA